MNRINKDIKDLMSVIITLVINVSRGGTVLNDGFRYNYQVRRAIALKKLIGIHFLFHFKGGSGKFLFGQETDQ